MSRVTTAADHYLEALIPEQLSTYLLRGGKPVPESVSTLLLRNITITGIIWVKPVEYASCWGIPDWLSLWETCRWSNLSSIFVDQVIRYNGKSQEVS